MKYIIIALLLLSPFFVHAQNKSQSLTLKVRKPIVKDVMVIAYDDGRIFLVVEEMPVFPGGDKALKKYISNKALVPDSIPQSKIEGCVYVQFVINKDGDVENVRVGRPLNKVLDQIALDIVSNMPQWEPGRQGGKTVNVSYTVPVNFIGYQTNKEE